MGIPNKRGFGQLPCPKCGADATVSVYLDELAGFHCCDCDEDFERADVEAFIRQWQRVLSWLDSAPAQEE
jgi:hypothetical protein